MQFPRASGEIPPVGFAFKSNIGDKRAQSGGRSFEFMERLSKRLFEQDLVAGFFQPLLDREANEGLVLDDKYSRTLIHAWDSKRLAKT